MSPASTSSAVQHQKRSMFVVVLALIHLATLSNCHAESVRGLKEDGATRDTARGTKLLANFADAQGASLGTFTIEGSSFEMKLGKGLEAAVSSLCPTIADTGLTYHIHEKWVPTTTSSAFGADLCGKTNLGQHYDPTLACGPNSQWDTTLCTTPATGTTEAAGACVPGSNAQDQPATGSKVYSCTSDTYAANPYVCEVGDLSGQYGKLLKDGKYSFKSPHGLKHLAPLSLISGKGVVVHCADSGVRLFCAKLVSSRW